MTEPDIFDTAHQPASGAEIPDAYVRYIRATFPPEVLDGAPNEIAGRWKYMTGPRERKFWAEADAALAAAAPSAVPLAPSPVLEQALKGRELFAEIVAAAQSYDHQFRPQGRTWSRVPDEQAARLIEGALLKLSKTGTGL